MSRLKMPSCQSCPFRRSNFGKRIPMGIYTEHNLRRLWQGLCEGERLACLEQESPLEETLQECKGALLLVARHLELLKTYSGQQYDDLALTPLTPEGVSRWLSRLTSNLDRGDSTTLELRPVANKSSTIGVPWDCPVTNASLEF